VVVFARILYSLPVSRLIGTSLGLAKARKRTRLMLVIDCNLDCYSRFFRCSFKLPFPDRISHRLDQEWDTTRYLSGLDSLICTDDDLQLRHAL
jgi:hypothetical protein